MKAMKHTHFYIRRSYKDAKGRDVYRCNHPQCGYIILKADLLGKMSSCSCGTEFVLTREDLRRVKPVCMACSNTNQAKQVRAAKELIGSFDFNNGETTAAAGAGEGDTNE